jgi:hypothetical protein
MRNLSLILYYYFSPWVTTPERHLILHIQTQYTSQILYCILQFCGKVAILLLYQRIFDIGISQWMRWSIIVCIILITAKDVVYLLLVVFQCIPVVASWDKTIPATCLSIDNIKFSGSISSIVTDIDLMVLPIPMFQILQVRFAKRAGLVFIFAVTSLYVLPLFFP